MNSQYNYINYKERTRQLTVRHACIGKKESNGEEGLDCLEDWQT